MSGTASKREEENATMPSVYVVEPQALFGPELARLVAEAGGRITGESAALDLNEILRAAPDVVLLDLDYTTYDVVDVLDVLRVEAPSIRPIVLTAERGRGWLDICRATGAAAVVAKAATDEEAIRDLRVVLNGGSVWDARAEAA
jgi:DNA-binding NarL/FixJ family response regulator